jgi:hypothetical protein
VRVCRRYTHKISKGNKNRRGRKIEKKKEETKQKL